MTMERIFPHFKDSNSPTSSYYDASDPNSYANYIHAMMSDAKDYEDAILAHERANAQMYYYGLEPSIGPYNLGEPYIGEDPNATLGEILDKDNENVVNRSTFVSTDVRDAVMLVLPSLIRLFGASESPVYLVPRTEADSEMADQATDYVNYVFWNDNPGFLTLYGAFKDAMTVKTGFVKWYTDDTKEIKRKTFVNVTADQLQMILSEDPSAKIIHIGKPVRGQPTPPSMSPMPTGAPPPAPPQSSPPTAPMGAPTDGPPPGAPPPQPSSPGGPPPGQPPAPPPGMPAGPMSGAAAPQLPPSLMQPPPPMFDQAVVQFEVSKPLIRIVGVPPEEMRLDRYARTFRDSRIVGHERIVAVDQLIAMGYDREQCLDNVQSSESTFTVEPQLRNPGRFMGTRIGDGVKYGEWYVKIDKDGDGHPELRYICTMGDDYEIVHDEEANRIKFALFSCDPISHTIVGDSLADYTSDIQRIKTNMMRAVLDSAAESLNPKTVVNELMVSIDDAMSDDLGAVIRTRGDPNASVMFTNTPFLGQQMAPMIEMLNDVLARRTGLTDAAKGLDPKALQSSTQIGVEAVINGAQERIELLARVLCETGFRDLFSGLYNEVCENPNQQRVMKIRGKMVPFDTGTFDASMSIEVNANLGKGSDMVRMLALNQIKQDQQMIITQYGLSNPVCGVQEMLNTITDMLALANVKNVGRYFRTPAPQQMQYILSQPKTPDPMAVAAQAQLEKVRADAAKAVSQQALDRQRLQVEDQFKHQQLHAKTAVDLQKLDIESRKVGAGHISAFGDLASKLIGAQSDSDAQDQQTQMDQAESQHQMNLNAQQQQSDQNNAMQKLAMAHMAKMTQLASQHHLGEQKNAIGALAAQQGGGEDQGP